MSDTQTQSYTPAEKTTRRPVSTWVWAVLLVFSIAVLGGTVWWAGGLSQVEGLVGSMHLSIPFLSGGGSGGKPAPALPAPAASAPTSTTLPPEAQQRMFAEQMESNTALTALVEDRIFSISFGNPQTAEQTATIPITATFTDGTAMKGMLILKQYGSAWYVFSIQRAGHTDSPEKPGPASIDQGVVSTITQQQAQQGTQQLVTHGLLGQGFREVKVEGVQSGPRTATVDVTLSGGSDAPAKGRFVCISTVYSGTTFWFVARFEKR